MKWLSEHFDSFMKLLVTIITLHGMAMITWSYILATLGIMEIAEDLSKTIVAQIIAPVVVYGLTKTVENVCKYNDVFTKNEDNVDEVVRGDMK